MTTPTYSYSPRNWQGSFWRKLRWEQILLLTTVIAIAVGAASISMAINLVYSVTTASDLIKAVMAGAAALMLDAVKLTMAIVVPIWFASRAYCKAFCGGLAFLLLTCCSIWFSIGFQSFNKADSAAVRSHTVLQYRELSGESKRLQQRLRKFDDARPVAAIEADLSAARQQKRWRSTAGCTDVTAARSLAFCTAYFSLKKQRARTQERDRIETRLAQVRRRLSARIGEKLVEEIDPQSQLIMRLTGGSRKTVIDVSTLLFALAIEIAASMSAFTAGWLYRRYGKLTSDDAIIKLISSEIDDEDVAPRNGGSVLQLPNEVQFGCVNEYMDERLLVERGALTGATILYEDYRIWCERCDCQPVTQKLFGTQVTAAGHDKHKYNGRVHYRDLKLGVA